MSIPQEFSVATALGQTGADLVRAEQRIAELEAAIREMHATIPGGTHCDPQDVADELREIATRVGVEIPD